MILINLLPHREAARKRQKDQFYTNLGLSALLGALICGGVFVWYQGRIAEQVARNDFLIQKSAELDLEIKDIASLQSEIASLRARQAAVEDLQADRNMPVHLLEDLVVQLPDGIYLNNIKQENRSVLVEGIAQSQERVSELLRNLANNSPWMERPELIEIVASNEAAANRGPRRVSNFKIRVQLTRPAVPAPPTAGATVDQAPVPAAVPDKV